MRIQFDTPLTARIGAVSVVLLDISTQGARIQHSFPLVRGKELVLTFDYRDQAVEMPCAVMRSRLEKHDGGVSYQSGLRFTEQQGLAYRGLRQMIASAVSEDFEARRQHLPVKPS